MAPPRTCPGVPAPRRAYARRPELRLARRRPWWSFFAPFWIALVFSLGLVSMLTGEPPEDSGGSLFIAVWAAIGAALVTTALYGLLHREELLLTPTQLLHTRRLGPFSRSSAYSRPDIEDVRVNPEGGSPFDPRNGLRMYGIGGGPVAFDYGDRTVRLGNVEEADAKRVVAALRDQAL